MERGSCSVCSQTNWYKYKYNSKLNNHHEVKVFLSLTACKTKLLLLCLLISQYVPITRLPAVSMLQRPGLSHRELGCPVWYSAVCSWGEAGELFLFNVDLLVMISQNHRLRIYSGASVFTPFVFKLCHDLMPDSELSHLFFLLSILMCTKKGFGVVTYSKYSSFLTHHSLDTETIIGSWRPWAPLWLLGADRSSPSRGRW